jgi:hypothetical protein
LTFLGKALNALLTPLDVLRLGWNFKRPMKLSLLKAQAAAYAKLPPDFGSDDDNDPTADDDYTWYRAKFSLAIDLLNQVPLTALGRFLCTNGLRNRFVARCRVRHALRQAGPACLERPVTSPVFVLGLPRTGTTFLHRLLSLDPQSRCPLTYELFDPGLEFVCACVCVCWGELGFVWYVCALLSLPQKEKYGGTTSGGVRLV